MTGKLEVLISPDPAFYKANGGRTNPIVAFDNV